MSTGWTHINKNLGMGLEEQWVFRPRNAPLCSLRREDRAWMTALLRADGISVNVLWLPDGLTLLEAQRQSERELRHMGHDWSTRDGARSDERTTRA